MSLTQEQKEWLKCKGALDLAKADLDAAKAALFLSMGYNRGQSVKIIEGARSGGFGKIVDFSVSGKRANLKISVEITRRRYTFRPCEIEIIDHL